MITTMLKKQNFVKLFSFLSIILLATSIFFPVGSSGLQMVDGYSMLLIGWIGAAVLQFGWFANLSIIWIGIRGIFIFKITKKSFLILIALSANTMQWNEIYTDKSTETITDWHLGYYFWWMAVASAIAASIANFIIKRDDFQWDNTHNTDNDI